MPTAAVGLEYKLARRYNKIIATCQLLKKVPIFSDHISLNGWRKVKNCAGIEIKNESIDSSFKEAYQLIPLSTSVNSRETLPLKVQ